MQKNILNELTFGFEIEGSFERGLRDKIAGTWKSDGSVHLDLRDEVPFYNDRKQNYGLEQQGRSVLQDSGGIAPAQAECDYCNGTGTINEECNCDLDYLVCSLPEHEHGDACYAVASTTTISSSAVVAGDLICELTEHIHNDDDECYEASCYDEDDDYHRVDCEECDNSPVGNSERGGISTEFNSDIYHDLDSMLKDLNKFNKRNYAWNKTCGLHFHVGARDGNFAKLFSIAASWDLMQKLNKEALEYCDHQKFRLEHHNRFCTLYKSKDHIISNARKYYGHGESKYLFCRFHPDKHTLEFRFFCPCEHKVKNIKRLMSSLTDYLHGSEKTKVLRNVETSQRVESVEYVREIGSAWLGQEKTKLIKQVEKAAALRLLKFGKEFNEQNCEEFGISLAQDYINAVYKLDKQERIKEISETLNFKKNKPDEDYWIFHTQIRSADRLGRREFIVQNRRTLEVRIYPEVVTHNPAAVLGCRWRYPKPPSLLIGSYNTNEYEYLKMAIPDISDTKLQVLFKNVADNEAHQVPEKLICGDLGLYEDSYRPLWQVPTEIQPGQFVPMNTRIQTAYTVTGNDNEI